MHVVVVVIGNLEIMFLFSFNIAVYIFDKYIINQTMLLLVCQLTVLCPVGMTLARSWGGKYLPNPNSVYYFPTPISSLFSCPHP